MSKGYWYILSSLVIILDQTSKFWANKVLIPYRPLPLLPGLNFTLAYNSGAAFSFLSGAGDWHRWFFSIFSLLVSAALIIWIYKLAHHQRTQLIGLSLILGGALGNLIDRLLHGYVVDFIDIYYKQYHFATFNIADSAITIGALFLAIDILKPSNSKG